MTNSGLYTPQLEHDSCGIGFVADLNNVKSNKIVKDALLMLRNMQHRGACGCEPETGDGAGIQIQIPHKFFKHQCTALGIDLPNFGKYGVGMMFFNKNPKVKDATKLRLNKLIDKLGFELLGYREVPRDNTIIGSTARLNEPICEQVFLKLTDNPGGRKELERKLFILRKHSTHSIGSTSGNAVEGNDYEFYWLSLSYKTIVYKGLLRTDQLPLYYRDLQDTKLESAMAIIHSRFSTNTSPKWKLAQPFRYITHNGEINTIRGNVNWMVSKRAMFVSKHFSKEDFDLLLPICDKSHSDSANLDSIVEMLTLDGRSLAHAMMMVIPEVWQGNQLMDKKKREFYEFHASLMEPWDGPASICFTDGNVVGATLDRNGLRPSRYCVTDDGLVVMSSEAGALPVDESKVITKGRLQPGKIFIADLKQGRIISDQEIKDQLSIKKPYGQWLKENKFELKDLPIQEDNYSPSKFSLLTRQLAFGFTQEDFTAILLPMIESSKEPIGSMALDIPLPILSEKPQHLSNYFKQLFAQVSNPPIDPIRERMVMSLYSALGRNLNTLDETPRHCLKIQLKHPVINDNELKKLINVNGFKGIQSKVIDILFESDGKPGRLKKAINKICKEASNAIQNDEIILILSDRRIDKNQAAIPSLLACGAVHQHLIKIRLRAHASIIIEAGDVRETHHFATLIGYGANAINPYLTLESLEDLPEKISLTKNEIDASIFDRYKEAIGSGLLKIFSKMGISTLQSYQGAQIFEILGLSDTVVNKCFKNSISRIGGISFDHLAEDILRNHKRAFRTENLQKYLPNEGVYQLNKEGEKHLFNPITIHLLQSSTRQNDYQLFKQYSGKINNQTQQSFTLRGLFEFNERQEIPIDEVEPIENILKRFATGAMSFGSLSHEAHSTLAIAMNRMGAKSNTGEGGEDYSRFARKSNGDWERSAIKQVASGRFGVTSYYLSQADELQIKIAQGAKPGEGGQLPGYKVDEWIGRVRNSTPGVGLISPPPHHDIYSIEDLAQLIFDLKNANRNARINVKLVAEAGVGTIASGVAKAKADVILISGHDGGTGASPLSSLRHTGLPWELGLAEAQQTLVRNKLRNRVVLQTDGQIKTGRDIVVATLLGAEEWGISTAALVVEGCIMMRKCHLNTCPVGITTQDPRLRKQFKGKPEHVINFFYFLAQEVRELMSKLGFRNINEMVGQSQVLRVRDNIPSSKLGNINLKNILFKQNIGSQAGIYHQVDQHHDLDFVLDWRLIETAASALKKNKNVFGSFYIVNTDRAVGAMLSYEVSKRYKAKGLPKETIHYKFKGSAGQSFGSFLAKGIYFELEGEANDYFGKGLSGGQIVVYPHNEAEFVPHENQLIGNVAFYGATDGEAYINGLAGERFCVRNSGVTVVVEGVGDHGCEYMTGGKVLILGGIGRNFAAGMSGGVAYVHHQNGKLTDLCNNELVDIEGLDEKGLDEKDYEILRGLIENHQRFTKSTTASEILAKWDFNKRGFAKIISRDYKKVLEQQEIKLKEII